MTSPPRRRGTREPPTTFGAAAQRTPTPGTFFQQVTPQQADVSQPWANSLEFYITPWGFLKGAAANNATVSHRKVDGKNYTVLTWSPTVKAPSGKSYVINGYVNEQNIVDRVETWLGENIMGDMHILATYTGWKDFGGVMAPSKIVQTRGGWPFFEVNVTAAKANPPDVATLVPAPPGRPWRWRGGGGAAGARACLTVTSEKLGDGLYRLTTGPGSYDSVIVEFKDYIMMLEAGQSEARGSGVHRRNEEADSEQADPVRHEHASPFRSHRRIAARWWPKARSSSRRRTMKSFWTRRSTLRERC